MSYSSLSGPLQLSEQTSFSNLQIMTMHIGDTQALSRLLCKVLKDANSLRQLTLAGDFSVKESQKR